ncbi:TPA: holo-ACP synthase [Streptococcus suis]|nr:holo-ACP synthase [Streptococcus suis]
MIVGHGIDFQDIDSINEARQKHSDFPKRILTDREFERYSQLNGRKQIEYLAGRWAAKEAFSKAMGTGIGKVGFQDVEILNNANGAPYISLSPFNGNVWISISHSGNFVQASVILEEKND